MRHFINLFDWSTEELHKLIIEAERLKKAKRRKQNPVPLQGRVIGLVFEKPSLRTRVSFQAAVAQLGGTSLFLPGNEVGLGSRESLPDFARTISQYLDAVVLRVYDQNTIDVFAEHSACPVINGLSNYSHPCQALADLLTIHEVFGKIEGKTVLFVGDGNNVARSLAIGCGKLGARFVLAAPKGYTFDSDFLRSFHEQLPRAELIENGEPDHVIGNADIVYTDVWASMGQEAEIKKRQKKFAKFQINGKLMQLAPPHARLMHCLPAHRGEEITSDVLDGERSIVFQQAANRMHAQKALLKMLLG